MTDHDDYLAEQTWKHPPIGIGLPSWYVPETKEPPMPTDRDVILDIAGLDIDKAPYELSDIESAIDQLTRLADDIFATNLASKYPQRKYPDCPAHIDLCKQMIDAVLHDRKPDNAATDDEPINHDTEHLTGALIRGYRDYITQHTRRGLVHYTAKDVCVFHLLHAMSRIIINALDGKVCYDKVVDCGGWAEVTADLVRSSRQEADGVV